MKDLVEYIAKSIVNAPDAVVVTEEQDEQGIILKLKVADEDKGRVIGKQGRIGNFKLQDDTLLILFFGHHDTIRGIND